MIAKAENMRQEINMFRSNTIGKGDLQLQDLYDKCKKDNEKNLIE